MKDDAGLLDVTAPQIRVGGVAMPSVTLGFIPLTDCAVLAVAREYGFAAREGINLQLSREVSWANIRDKVALGHLDGAQMLAGMPIAAALGINQRAMPMLVPFCLNRNGNAISVSGELYDEMIRLADPPGPETASAWGAALCRIVAARKSTSRSPLTFGMVFPFSCHNYELRYWMAACGIDPDTDVRLVVVPPPLMVDSLRDRHIDGFCVGEPWNSLGVESGLSRIIVTKPELWRNGTEKVLGVPAAWAARNAEVLSMLIRALDQAAAWAEEPAHRAELASLLARREYLGVPAHLIASALSGELTAAPGHEARRIPDFLLLHRDRANCPSPDHALWIYSQMVRWRQWSRRPGDDATIAATYRPDIYHAALAGEGWSVQVPHPQWQPGAMGGEAFFDGRRFDPTDIDGYLAPPVGE